MDATRRTELQTAFLESVVHVVSEQGLGRATTRAIAEHAGLNEAYIYRCFSNKEDMLRAAFHREDLRFVQLVLDQLPVMGCITLSIRVRCFQLWRKAWAFVLEKPEDCKFYLRYYFSQNYLLHARTEHLQCFQPLLEAMAPLFLPGKNVSILLHQVFETMLSFAVKVMDGELPDDLTTAVTVFEQVYGCVSPHLRDTGIDAKKRSTAQ